MKCFICEIKIDKHRRRSSRMKSFTCNICGCDYYFMVNYNQIVRLHNIYYIPPKYQYVKEERYKIEIYKGWAAGGVLLTSVNSWNDVKKHMKQLASMKAFW